MNVYALLTPVYSYSPGLFSCSYGFTNIYHSLTQPNFKGFSLSKPIVFDTCAERFRKKIRESYHLPKNSGRAEAEKGIAELTVSENNQISGIVAIEVLDLVSGNGAAIIANINAEDITQDTLSRLNGHYQCYLQGCSMENKITP